MTPIPGPEDFGPDPRCDCGADQFMYDKNTRGSMAHHSNCGVVMAMNTNLTGADALRYLDAQFGDPAELRSAAYERQRARYAATTTPADALRWLGEHTSCHVGEHA